jgi:hypothetical protein
MYGETYQVALRKALHGTEAEIALPFHTVPV